MHSKCRSCIVCEERGRVVLVWMHQRRVISVDRLFRCFLRFNCRDLWVGMINFYTSWDQEKRFTNIGGGRWEKRKYFVDFSRSTLYTRWFFSDACHEGRHFFSHVSLYKSDREAGYTALVISLTTLRTHVCTI